MKGAALFLLVGVAFLTLCTKSAASTPASRQRLAKSISEERNIRISADGVVVNLLRAHDELPAAVWKRLLEVRDRNGAMLAHYLIFNLHGTFFSYSPRSGSKRIWPAGVSATAFARAANADSSVTGVFFTPANVATNTQRFPFF
jgi:hypothetical protein